MRGKNDVTTFPDKPVSRIASLFRAVASPRSSFTIICTLSWNIPTTFLDHSRS